MPMLDNGQEVSKVPQVHLVRGPAIIAMIYRPSQEAARSAILAKALASRKITHPGGAGQGRNT